MSPDDRARVTEYLRSIQAGDLASIRPMFRTVWPVLTAFARRYGVGDSDAEDVTQRAIIKLLERLDDYDPARDGMSWVFAIALCEIRTFRRQQSRRREMPMDRVVDSPDRTEAHDPIALRETWKKLEGALGALSPSDRQVLRETVERRHARHALDAAARKRKQRALERLALKLQASLSENFRIGPSSLSRRNPHRLQFAQETSGRSTQNRGTGTR